MKRLLTTTICFVLCLSLGLTAGTVSAASYDNSDNSDTAGDEEQIEQVIRTFYAKCYKIWWTLSYSDLSDVLDLDSVQCYNKVTALKRNIETQRYGIAMGYFSRHPAIITITNLNKTFTLETAVFRHTLFHFISFEFDGDTAVVHVDISYNPNIRYVTPVFLSTGDNTFTMVKKNGRWLISGHEYYDWVYYEGSLTEKLEYDPEAVRAHVDEMCGTDSETNLQDNWSELRTITGLTMCFRPTTPIPSPR